MDFSVGKIVGIPRDDAWAQVFVLRPEGNGVRPSPLFACLDLEGRIGKDLAVLGREVVSVLEREFFQKSREESTLTALKRAVRMAVEEVKETLSEGEEVEFNLLCGTLKEDILYLVQLGRGQIYLWRKNRIGPILEEGGEEIREASGWVKEGDILLLATPLFWKRITLGELRAGLAGGEIEEIVSRLTPKISNLEFSATMAVLFVRFEERGEEFFPEVRTRRSFLPPRRIPVIRIQREKRILLAVGFLLSLLTLSLFKGITKRDYLAKKAEFQSLSSRFREKVKIAEEISIFKPEEAEKVLAEAEEILEKMEKLKVEREVVEREREKLAEKRGEILNIFQKKPEIVFDLDLIKKTETFSLSFVGGKVLVLSPGVVFAIDPEEKRGEMVGIEEGLREGKFLAENFVFSLKGIWVVDPEKREVEKIIEEGEDWGEVRGFSVFQKNLYLLFPDQIRKYTATASGYLPPGNWLREEVDLSGGIDLAIDGAIYVLRQDGLIQKLLRGKKERFAPSLKEPLNPLACFTSPLLENFYLLDREGRVVVLDKEGRYQRQYRSPLLAGAKDFVVDSQGKKIYFLVGSKIYRFDL